MSKEIIQVPKKEFIRKKTIFNAARVALAGGLSFAIMSCAQDSAHDSKEHLQNISSPSPITLINEDKNEKISDLLDNNYARAGLAGTLGMALGMTISAHYLGKRYDESKLHALRVVGPIVMAASASTGLLDSFITIDRHIPISLFLASTLLIASQHVINTFEHYKDRKIRTAALSTAVMLSSLGVTAFMAFK